MCVHVHVHVIAVTPIYLQFLLQCSHYTEVMEAIGNLASSLSALQQKMTALISAVSDIKDTQNCIEMSILDIRKEGTKRLHPPPRYPISTHEPPTTPISSTPGSVAPCYMSESFVDATSTHKDSDVSLLEPSSKTTKDDPDVTSIPMDSDTIMKLRYVSSSRRNFAANMMRRIFSKAEREVSNVLGKLGKAIRS